METSNLKGLQHEECLNLLHDQIEDVLIDYKSEHLKLSTLFRAYISEQKFKFIYNLLPIFLCSLLLFISILHTSEHYVSNFLNGLFILLLSVFNLVCLFFFYVKRSLIIYEKAGLVLSLIRNLSDSGLIDIKHYDIQMPYSQSITCQETVRDGKLYNMPLNLIVKGDLIQLKPGHMVNIQCQRVDANGELTSDCCDKGKVYEPSPGDASRKSSQIDETYFGFEPMPLDTNSFLNSYIESCELKDLPKPIYCRALETPYLTHLRSVLHNHKNDSDSLIANEINTVIRKILFYLIPSFLTLQVLVSIIYYFILNEHESLLTNIAYLLLPLFPVSFTLFWKISTLHGTVTLLKSLKCLKKIMLNKNLNSEQKEKRKRKKSHQNTKKEKCAKYRRVDDTSDNNPNNTTTECIIEDNHSNLSQDDLSQMNELSSIESLIAAMPAMEEQPRSNPIRSYFSRINKKIRFYFNTVHLILFNKPSLMQYGQVTEDLDVQNASFMYYSNFLIGLGIITNFACIDKKGVLSWPNPTADKILVFNKAKNNECKSADMENEFENDQQSVDMFNSNQQKVRARRNSPEKDYIETHNLTHDNCNGYQLKFDDINWTRNVNSLKPLGLSILLNTCNMKLSDLYNRLCDFIKVESNKILQSNQMQEHMSHFHFATDASSFDSNLSITDENFDLKAVIDRRCLCEISKIIGFNPALTLSSHRVLGSSSICRNLEIKPVSKVKPKQIRVSSLFSTVTSDQRSNCTLNLYSQGSPDLIFDFCNDYWNGEQVCELNKNQRKKLLDLYQRYSAASYCTAFSYKPLLAEKKLQGNFKENSEHILKCPPSYCEKISSLSDFCNLVDPETESENFSLNEFDNGSYDTDNLSIRSNDNDSTGNNKNQTQIESMLNLHSGQIFLGLLSMQYSAKTDVIKLVEKLEKCCIRFIHFSSENEHISRTFAEMLGLDTGWNCHISLSSGIKKLTEEEISEMSKPVDKSLNPTDRLLLNKLSIFKTIRSKENFRLRGLIKKKKTQGRRHVNYMDSAVYSSLPDLKMNKSFCPSNQKGQKMTQLDQNQIEILCSDGKSKHLVVKTCKQRKKRNLKRLNSSCSYYESSDSNEFNELDSSKAKLLKASSKLEDVESASLTSHSATHVMSAELQPEDDNSSLSDVEILGNAAQLPKGIPAIRHHLANEIDNVPLHVSLFTDSTKPAITQMIEIMKDYGEIVVCFGSTHSIENNEIFSISNIGIGVEPLYPKLCVNNSSNVRSYSEDDLDSSHNDSSVNELTVYMNTLSCGLNLKHENICILPPLLSLAREIIHSYRIALVFMLMCNLTVSMVQLICNLLFLPPILSGFQVIFLVMFTIPVLSYSLINKNESYDLRCSNKKNSNLINGDDVKSFLRKFLFKFMPSACILVLFHFMNLYIMCKEINQTPQLANDTLIFANSTVKSAERVEKCSIFAIDVFFADYHEDHSFHNPHWSNYDSLLFSQIFNHFFLSIYFVFISLNYVCIEKSLWQYIPFKNKTWTKTICVVMLFHLVYLFFRLYTTIERTVEYWHTIPGEYWVITTIWPILLLFLNEFFKLFEIKETLRQYKKLKLDFDTKLGMNSPFV